MSNGMRYADRVIFLVVGVLALDVGAGPQSFYISTAIVFDRPYLSGATPLEDTSQTVGALDSLRRARVSLSSSSWVHAWRCLV